MDIEVCELISPFDKFSKNEAAELCWQMPLLGGLEATRKIRDLQKAGQLPNELIIWVVTGNARESYFTQSLQAGMVSCEPVPLW